jgi:hypothetical protein
MLHQGKMKMLILGLADEVVSSQEVFPQNASVYWNAVTIPVRPRSVKKCLRRMLIVEVQLVFRDPLAMKPRLEEEEQRLYLVVGRFIIPTRFPEAFFLNKAYYMLV